MRYDFGLNDADLAYHGAWFPETMPKGSQWEWAQTFGVPMQVIRQLETGRFTPDPQGQELHWCREHRDGKAKK
jgi:hypothetical protein